MVPILQQLKDHVVLRKRKNLWLACCPFHYEKTPSFVVDPVQNKFYCFGCGIEGDGDDFIKRKKLYSQMVENITEHNKGSFE